MRDTDHPLPREHLHSDRPNWWPAETPDEYLTNVREGLEEYRESRMARLMGVPRVYIWRARAMADLPEDLFERLLAAGVQSSRELANVAMALRGDHKLEVERCPCCGHLLRVRGLRRVTVDTVNEWLAEQRDR